LGYKRAIILGNGESRRGIEIPDDCVVWGCNYIYREIIHVDVLVATDVYVQHDVYVDKYALNNRCIFLDWTPVPSTIPLDIVEGLNVVKNDFTEHGVVCSGWKNDIFYTYLEENDCVENVTMSEIPRRFSSGSLAMWKAAQEGYNEILLAGFGDDAHMYAGRDHEPGKERFTIERNFIINEYENIKWRYI